MFLPVSLCTYSNTESTITPNCTSLLFESSDFKFHHDRFLGNFMKLYFEA